MPPIHLGHLALFALKFKHLFPWRKCLSLLPKCRAQLLKLAPSPPSKNDKRKLWAFVGWVHGVTPGSHMPPIYLGHRHGICEHLSPNHIRSQALTTGRVQASRRLLAIKIILYEHHLRTDDLIHIYRWNGWNYSNSICIRANLGLLAIHRRSARDPLKQIADRCQLQPATTSQVDRRDMRTRTVECLGWNICPIRFGLQNIYTTISTPVSLTRVLVSFT